MSQPGNLPEQISHYRILEHVGRGGMGNVYLAEDLRLGRRVALKILPGNSDGALESRNRFQLEARTTSALNHPNIVTIHEIDHFGDYEFIAQEYVRGRTVRNLLDERGLDVSEVLDVAIGVTSALVAAHEAGIIHRDIKPENIMVRDDGLVKVLDFGIAKRSTPRDEETGADTGRALTDPGAVMGTFRYMSPEQILTFELDDRADLFSLGVVIYEMINGATPFGRETRGDTVKSILFDEPPPLQSPDLPERLRKVVAKLLSKERGDRIQSSRELLDALVSIREEMARDLPRAGQYSLAGLVERSRSGPILALRAAASAGHRRRWWPATALLVVTIALALVFTRISPADGPEIESIAVVPFAGPDGGEGQYLATILTEETTQRLGRIGQLHVLASNTMNRYRGSSKSASEIGDELDVDALVLGTITGGDGQWRISVDLIETDEGTLLWGRSYRSESADVPFIHETISRDLTETLRIELSGEEQQRVARPLTEDSEAYDEYLRGRYLWRDDHAGNCPESIGHFERAIELDPTFALAYAGLADCYNVMGSYSEISPEGAFPVARDYATRALRLDDSLGPAHVALAYTMQNYDWDWEGAEREYLRAFDLQPSHAAGRYWYGGFLALMGRFEEASEQRAIAHALDPLSMSYRTGQGTPHLLARDYERAISYYRRAIHVDPMFPQAHRSLGWAYIFRGGMDEEAIREFTAAERLEGRSSERSPELAYAWARAGHPDRARRILANLEKDQKVFVSPYDVALVRIALGDLDSAFRLLDEAVDQHSNRVTALRVDPALDPIREDPRFETLLWKTGLHTVPEPRVVSH